MKRNTTEILPERHKKPVKVLNYSQVRLMQVKNDTFENDHCTCVCQCVCSTFFLSAILRRLSFYVHLFIFSLSCTEMRRVILLWMWTSVATDFLGFGTGPLLLKTRLAKSSFSSRGGKQKVLNKRGALSSRWRRWHTHRHTKSTFIF